MLAITSLRDPDAPGPTIYVSMIVDSGANVSLLAIGAPEPSANWWGRTFDLELRFTTCPGLQDAETSSAASS